MNVLGSPLVACLAVLVVALVASIVVRGSRRDVDPQWPFQETKPLARVEQILYYRMLQSLPDHVVLAHVPLSRFLRVRKGRTWREWHDRISRKSVDFLVCERDFSIVAAIELDDASHDSMTRPPADATKSRALAAAGVPLVRWRATALPTVEMIRTVIDDIRRERGSDPIAAPRGRVVAALHATRIDASNDPTMVGEETQQ